MKIGIETNILSMDKAGAAVYTRELIKHLKLADNINSYYYLDFGLKIRKGNLFLSKAENIIRDTLWMQFALGYELKNKKIDLLHCPAFKAPLRCPVPLIVTFYDIHILKNPKDYNPWLRLYCKFMLRKIAASATRIITISEFSRNDIAETLSVPKEKIAVTYCGINDKFSVITDTDLKNEIWKKYKFKKRFILYVGALQPRKNIPLLLKAYSELKKNGTFDYELVIAGSTGWRNKNIFVLIEKLGLKNDVMFLGYVPEDDLPVIYNLAEFFVYPSFFEGFGMPVLEAMACGCPVISSNTSSLPEVIGEAGIMIDPNNIEDLKDAMIRMTQDHSLKNEMREKGIKRAKLFSWDKCARETLEVYRKAVNP